MSETSTGTTDSDRPRAVTGARRGADAVFGYLTMLLLLGLLVQFFLAGWGVFGLDGQALDKADSFEPHEALGHILSGVALLMLIAALVARTSKLAMWGSLALVLLIELVQTALADAGKDHDVLGGLHALDGVVITTLAVLLHLTWRRRRELSR